jgi:hypothetical protein
MLLDGGAGGGHEGSVLYSEFGETRRLANGRLYVMQVPPAPRPPRASSVHPLPTAPTA